MNVLYISYWGVNDGLTDATVFPYLERFIESSNITMIHFITVERDKYFPPEFLINNDKIQHIPIKSAGLQVNKLKKFFDILYIKKEILSVVKNKNIDKVFCKGAMAGAFGYSIYKKYGIPFYVDSFEPHADYMYEAGTWSRFGMKYIMQKYWERQQIKHATKVFTVSNNYKDFLIGSGIKKESVEVVPVCVNQKIFQFNNEKRQQIRSELGIENKIVGVYVGKFGDMYYDNEAFEFFYACRNYFKDNFFLMLLSPDRKEIISANLSAFNFTKSEYVIKQVPHQLVPEYLSASDFAISMMRSTQSKKYCSPTKHGEYMAIGLPIILADGIGDDSKIVEVEKIGVVLNKMDSKNFQEGLIKLDNLLHGDTSSLRKIISDCAFKYRGFHFAERIYSSVLEYND